MQIVEYDDEWCERFAALRQRLWPALADVATRIEHVGSTAVPGLAAKPILDMTVAVRAESDIATAIARLEAVGYRHQGDLGIEGREAFEQPIDLPRHHLYLCAEGAVALLNHLTVREYLRAHPGTARRYGALKKALAARFPGDRTAYGTGKTEFLLGVLRAAGLREEQLAAIERANRR